MPWPGRARIHRLCDPASRLGLIMSRVLRQLDGLGMTKRAILTKADGDVSAPRPRVAPAPIARHHAACPGRRVQSQAAASGSGTGDPVDHGPKPREPVARTTQTGRISLNASPNSRPRTRIVTHISRRPIDRNTVATTQNGAVSNVNRLFAICYRRKRVDTCRRKTRFLACYRGYVC